MKYLFFVAMIILPIFFTSVASSKELSEYQLLERQVNLDLKNREVENISLSLKYDKALVEFRTKQMDHNITILKWQHYSGIGVFFLVIVLVKSGLYLSYLQFKKEEKYPSESTTKVEASAKGINIDSPVIGLIILFMSFAFFYLYIMEVYTIKPISLEQQKSVSAASSITNQSSRPPTSATD